jgi:hypothetical protein
MEVWVLVKEVEYDNGRYEPVNRVPVAMGVFLTAEEANAEIARRLLNAAHVSPESDAVVIAVEAQTYRLMRTTLQGDLSGLTEAPSPSEENYRGCRWCGKEYSVRHSNCPDCGNPHSLYLYVDDPPF